jgi:prepilin-type N-terminal cleavage/methylation domain-containing protein
MTQRRASLGYTLIELFVVLAIVGILAVVGVSMMGNRQTAAVRTLMDQVEGAITNAQQLATATNRDVALDTWGAWSSANSLVLAYGDAALTDNNLQTTANNLLINVAPNAGTAYSQTVAVPLHYYQSAGLAGGLFGDAGQSRAEILVAGSGNAGDWTTALAASGSGSNTDPSTIEPFLTQFPAGTLSTTNNLFKDNLTRLVINGSSHRFATTFIIEILGTSPNQGAMAGSPMGLIVGLANGAAIYKFYNPGVLAGANQWRRM